MSGAALDFLASESHFVDHLAPIWGALAPGERGTFWVPAALQGHALRRGVLEIAALETAAELQVPLRLPALELLRAARGRRRTRRGERALLPAALLPRLAAGRARPAPDAPMVVASYGDLRRVANGLRPVALSEHGVGQTYGNQHPSYCGGVSAERRQVGLFLVPNAAAAEANRRVQPDAAIAVVGVPRLDRFVTRPAAPEPGSPLVALSFHWPCAVAPETRGAFPHYRAALPELARHFRLLGHGHPRVLDRLARGYQRLGIPVAADFEEVLARASLYVADNSSTLYEFAAAGRPVVVLNAPWFRRHVEHGLRFWRYADVGVQCDRPEDLVAAVRRALDDPPEQELRRRRAVDAVVPLRDGRSAARAADALRAWLGWPARAAEEARA